MIGEGKGELNAENIEIVGIENIKNSIEQIKSVSPILLEMLNNQEISIVGAIYNVASGKVDFI